MTEDKNFDGLVEHFENKIYGSLKGKIRLQLLKDELLKQVLSDRGNLNVLDIAGGLGQLTIWLSSLGHRVTYVDISHEMLLKAQQKAKVAGVFSKIHWLHLPLQQLSLETLAQFPVADPNHKNQKAHFDLILAHAVLEWLGKPFAGLDDILKLMNVDTTLSLSFYNRQSIILHNVLRGNFRKVLSDDFRGVAGGLTPLNPLNPDDIRRFLKQNNCIIEDEMGLRSFYDYLPKQIKEKINARDIIEMEQRLSHQQPFVDMARYVHFMVRNKQL